MQTNQTVLNLLKNLLNPATLREAQYQLNQFKCQSEFLTQLIMISIDKSIRIEMRQMSLICLKTLVVESFEQKTYTNSKIQPCTSLIPKKGVNLVFNSLLDIIIRLINQKQLLRIAIEIANVFVIETITITIVKQKAKHNKQNNQAINILTLTEQIKQKLTIQQISFQQYFGSCLLLKIILQKLSKCLTKDGQLNDVCDVLVPCLLRGCDVLTSRIIFNNSQNSATQTYQEMIIVDFSVQILKIAIQMHFPNKIKQNAVFIINMIKNTLCVQLSSIKTQNIAGFIKLKISCLSFLVTIYNRHLNVNNSARSQNEFIQSFHQNYSRNLLQSIFRLVNTSLQQLNFYHAKVIKTKFHKEVVKQTQLCLKLFCLMLDINKVRYLMIKQQNTISDVILKKMTFLEDFTKYLINSQEDLSLLQEFKRQVKRKRQHLITYFIKLLTIKSQNKEQKCQQYENAQITIIYLIDKIKNGVLKMKEIVLYILAQLANEMLLLSRINTFERIFTIVKSFIMFIISQIKQVSHHQNHNPNLYQVNFKQMNCEKELIQKMHLCFIQLRVCQVITKYLFLSFQQNQIYTMCQYMYSLLQYQMKKTQNQLAIFQIVIYVKIQALRAFNKLIQKEYKIIKLIETKIEQILRIHIDLMIFQPNVIQLFHMFLKSLQNYTQSNINELLGLFVQKFFQNLRKTNVKYQNTQNVWQTNKNYQSISDDRFYGQQQQQDSQDNMSSDQCCSSQLNNDNEDVCQFCLSAIIHLLILNQSYKNKQQQAQTLPYKKPQILEQNTVALIFSLIAQSLSQKSQRYCQQAINIMNLIILKEKQLIIANSYVVDLCLLFLHSIFIIQNNSHYSFAFKHIDIENILMSTRSYSHFHLCQKQKQKQKQRVQLFQKYKRVIQNLVYILKFDEDDSLMFCLIVQTICNFIRSFSYGYGYQIRQFKFKNFQSTSFLGYCVKCVKCVKCVEIVEIVHESNLFTQKQKQFVLNIYLALIESKVIDKVQFCYVISKVKQWIKIVDLNLNVLQLKTVLVLSSKCKLLQQYLHVLMCGVHFYPNQLFQLVDLNDILSLLIKVNKSKNNHYQEGYFTKILIGIADIIILSFCQNNHINQVNQINQINCSISQQLIRQTLQQLIQMLKQKQKTVLKSNKIIQNQEINQEHIEDENENDFFGSGQMEQQIEFDFGEEIRQQQSYQEDQCQIYNNNNKNKKQKDMTNFDNFRKNQNWIGKQQESKKSSEIMQDRLKKMKIATNSFYVMIDERAYILSALQSLSSNSSQIMNLKGELHQILKIFQIK